MNKYFEDKYFNLQSYVFIRINFQQIFPFTERTASVFEYRCCIPSIRRLSE